MADATPAPDDHRELLALINSQLDLLRIYQGCHRILRRRMRAANMYICLREGDNLRFPYFVDEVEPENPLDLYPKQGLSGYMLDTGETFWLRERGGFPEGVKLIGGHPSDYLGVPFRDRQGMVTGAIAIQTYRPGTFYSEDDRRFLDFAANGLSLAIQRATVERELAAYRMAALAEDTVDSDELFGRIHEVVAGVIPASRKNLIFARVDEPAGVFRAEYLHDEHWPYPSGSWPLDSGLSGYIYTHHKRSLIFENGRTALPPEASLVASQAPTFWLGSPLVMRGRIIGMVIVQSYSADEPITREDEYALNALCPHIASALARALLFNRLRTP